MLLIINLIIQISRILALTRHIFYDPHLLEVFWSNLREICMSHCLEVTILVQLAMLVLKEKFWINFLGSQFVKCGLRNIISWLISFWQLRNNCHPLICQFLHLSNPDSCLSFLACTKNIITCVWLGNYINAGKISLLSSWLECLLVTKITCLINFIVMWIILILVFIVVIVCHFVPYDLIIIIISTNIACFKQCLNLVI